MRLNKIILHGFKSFADKTEFSFEDSITGIVGPNGCGKSNVVDAVKWVLGEQSKKSLRSSQMADVIFSGSSKRKASGMAEVVMIFGDVDGEGSELQITRRLYRDGDSTYLMNGKTCRLKDIREQFMDTGVGVSAYSIIEQGQIGQLLSASKKERRMIFEEAAGISKFKAHKKEAQRKLEKTEERMLRVADIYNEVQKQLRSVKLQAGKARNYVEYKERLDKLRMQYYLAEYKRLEGRKAQTETELAGVKESCAEVFRELSRLEALQSELQNSLREKEHTISSKDGEIIAVKGRIEQTSQRADFLMNRLDELSKRKTDASKKISELDNQKTMLEAEVYRCENELSDVASQAQSKQDQLSELQELLNEAELDVSSINSRIEDQKTNALDAVRKTTQIKNEIQNSQNRAENLRIEKERLSKSVSSQQAQLESSQQDKKQKQKELEEVKSRLEELSGRLEANKDMIARLNEEISEKVNHAASEKQEKSALEREYRLLNELEKSNEGVGKSVSRLLDEVEKSPENYSYICGLASKIFESDVKHSVAVEAGLGEMVNWLIVEDCESFVKDWKPLADKSGRLGAIENGQVPAESASQSRHRRLSEFVRCSEKFSGLKERLFSSFIVAEDIDNALQLRSGLKEGEQIVTLSGEIVGAGGRVKFGRGSGNLGIISRKSRMNELNTKIEDVQKSISEIEAGIDENNSRHKELSETASQIGSEIEQANSDRYKAQSSMQLVDQAIENIQRDLPESQRELEGIDEKIREAEKAKEENEASLKEIEQQTSSSDSLLEELRNQSEEKQQYKNELNSQVTNLRINIGQDTVKRNALKQELSGLKGRIESVKLNIKSVRSDIEGGDEQIESTTQSVLNAESDLSELYSRKENLADEASELRKNASELFEKLSETEKDLKEKKESNAEGENRLHKLDLDLSETKIKIEDLIQKAADELETDITTQQQDQQFEESEVNWDEIKQEISELKAKIFRLGNVNVDAIDQQDELEKREAFLSEQIDDLTESKNKLSELINRINVESREKFQDTFEKVRENFKEIFRKLFGGGKADIHLDDEDEPDILECGIEIIAQPPGKGAKAISLLSGGEKTMTAIALLFAIFKTKPSPFCFLDEVDAALDEANNERFNMIVQEFQKDSQFIIVTHAKRTMSIADKLFGVTMQQQGVSKRITVKFDSEDTDAA
ncbi:Chromosome partition protein Smc [Sedimentisphaera cyanobacteriorum]|uniref:Chromosome partition protein Smc n=1 Tax=Sedimentisphaera cyanobacteriorum TaxID=1940790 RepID=A0A1Q2HLQ8_9BACT|nr:chromosome segregation protein SMC [Sedimentisphaera cyanobacteriorum]AQQ08280.1 Chromosome partition protein Smc [Sedimentisphaera cyanobacteriorum]